MSVVLASRQQVCKQTTEAVVAQPKLFHCRELPKAIDRPTGAVTGQIHRRDTGTLTSHALPRRGIGGAADLPCPAHAVFPGSLHTGKSSSQGILQELTGSGTLQKYSGGNLHLGSRCER